MDFTKDGVRTKTVVVEKLMEDKQRLCRFWIYNAEKNVAHSSMNVDTLRNLTFT